MQIGNTKIVITWGDRDSWFNLFECLWWFIMGGVMMFGYLEIY